MKWFSIRNIFFLNICNGELAIIPIYFRGGINVPSHAIIYRIYDRLLAINLAELVYTGDFQIVLTVVMYIIVLGPQQLLDIKQLTLLFLII